MKTARSFQVTIGEPRPQIQVYIEDPVWGEILPTHFQADSYERLEMHKVVLGWEGGVFPVEVYRMKVVETPWKDLEGMYVFVLREVEERWYTRSEADGIRFTWTGWNPRWQIIAVFLDWRAAQEFYYWLRGQKVI